MIDTIIVSGGNIHSDFALDFLKKNEPNPFLISLLHGSQKNKKISKKK